MNEGKKESLTMRMTEIYSLKNYCLEMKIVAAISQQQNIMSTEMPFLTELFSIRQSN